MGGAGRVEVGPNLTEGSFACWGDDLRLHPQGSEEPLTVIEQAIDTTEENVEKALGPPDSGPTEQKRKHRKLRAAYSFALVTQPGGSETGHEPRPRAWPAAWRAVVFPQSKATS